MQHQNSNDYLFVFFQSTNNMDIEIAQYIKCTNGKWQLVEFNLHKYLDEN